MVSYCMSYCVSDLFMPSFFLVLNLSGNQLTTIDKSISNLSSLKALILNNNEIVKVGDDLASLSQLNTLGMSMDIESSQ